MTKAQLLRLCLDQRCKHEENYHLSSLWILFYTLKVCLCVLLSLECKDCTYDGIQVAYYGWHPTFDGEFSGESGYIIIVNQGVFLGWSYFIAEDGYP